MIYGLETAHLISSHEKNRRLPVALRKILGLALTFIDRRNTNQAVLKKKKNI